LESNREIWIGIKYELNPITHVAGIDKGPIVHDRNFVFMDDKWSYAFDERDGGDDFNWYISGYFQFDNNPLNTPANSWLRAITSAPTNYVIYRNGEKIATTTEPKYVDSRPPSGFNIYCVSLAYDDGEESEPVCVQAIVPDFTSIDPINNSDGEIDIFPNPIQKGETLVIQFDSQIASTLSIYNISGQLTHQEQITGGTVYKKMDFEPGIYLLQIRNNFNTFIRKIIIK